MLAFPQVAIDQFYDLGGVRFSASHLLQFFDSYFKISRIRRFAVERFARCMQRASAAQGCARLQFLTYLRVALLCRAMDRCVVGSVTFNVFFALVSGIVVLADLFSEVKWWIEKPIEHCSKIIFVNGSDFQNAFVYCFKHCLLLFGKPCVDSFIETP